MSSSSALAAVRLFTTSPYGLSTDISSRPRLMMGTKNICGDTSSTSDDSRDAACLHPDPALLNPEFWCRSSSNQPKQSKLFDM
eukprot:CAMPEP_0173257814 /NCGR_PEP_ID=MMETSP1142-20121109/23997_1 /TAXON_ID=483371 /ORGANISM="non described non described, Strain CCMP2298" /LENGTH=82 /DNA_ID=CAMNT_0014192021 /DNA_START=223 /DNA_END=468 /DNA_ORIENTATION=-